MTGGQDGICHRIDHVGGGDEIDIVGAPVLQFQHLGCQFVHRQQPIAPGLEFLADLVVLAKDIDHIAPGKKRRPGATPARDWRPFAVMQADVGYLNLAGGAVKAGLAGQSPPSKRARV